MGLSEAGDAFQKASKMHWLCPFCQGDAKGKNSRNNASSRNQSQEPSGKSKIAKNSLKKKSSSVAREEPKKIKKVKK